MALGARSLGNKVDALLEEGGAPERSLVPAAESAPEFVLLVSCIGRQVLQFRTAETGRRRGGLGPSR